MQLDGLEEPARLFYGYLADGVWFIQVQAGTGTAQPPYCQVWMQWNFDKKNEKKKIDGLWAFQSNIVFQCVIIPAFGVPKKEKRCMAN